MAGCRDGSRMSIFKGLTKAALGVVVDLPISIVKDIATLGGAVIDEESAVVKSCKNIQNNVDIAVKPERDK